MKYLIYIILFFTQILVKAQGGWSFQELPQMPFKTSNNAVSSAIVNDTTYVYSFFGIDTTKEWSGIHSKAFKYNTVSQIWDTLLNISDSLGGVIAAGASTINNKIYIIGGYHVYSNSNEISSYETIIFDPETNSYSRGKNIPIEIDDHIQLTYKDSLIYVISGWTSSIGGGNNTNKVQVYDAINDEWYFANDMPNIYSYKVFGGSGSIINDTIIFAGGARYATNFPLVEELRKGVINTSNPLEISWTIDTVIQNFKPYRSACLKINNKAFWVGGSSVSYNYDGIAYNNSGGVQPNDFITEYNNKTNKWAQYDVNQLEVMDLRGISKVSNNSFIISGGMIENQEISDKNYLLIYDTTFTSSTDYIDVVNDTISLEDNHLILIIEKNNYFYHIKSVDVESIMVFDLFGRAIKKSNSSSISMLGEQGIYFFNVTLTNGTLYRKKILVR